jgi:hypothetical protein
MQYIIRAYNDEEAEFKKETASTEAGARTAAKRMRSQYNPFFVQVTKGYEVVARYDRLKKGYAIKLNKTSRLFID